MTQPGWGPPQGQQQQGQWGPPQGQQPQAGWGPPPQQGQWGPPPQQGQQQGQWGPPPQQGWGPPQGQQQQGGWGPPPQGPPAQQGPPPTLADFVQQPSSGFGPSLQFPQVGTKYLMIVARDLTEADVEHNTQPGTNGMPAYYRDGRAKITMKVPVFVPKMPPRYAEGHAQLYCRGQMWDQLNAAMASVNERPYPNGLHLPRKGAAIFVDHNASRPGQQGMNPSKQYSVQYYPAGAQPMELAAQFGIEYPMLSENPDTGQAISQTGPQQAQQPAAQGPDPRWGMAPEQAVQYQQGPPPQQEQYQQGAQALVGQGQQQPQGQQWGPPPQQTQQPQGQWGPPPPNGQPQGPPPQQAQGQQWGPPAGGQQGAPEGMSEANAALLAQMSGRA